jgi:hypothetical protein
MMRVVGHLIISFLDLLVNKSDMDDAPGIIRGGKDLHAISTAAEIKKLQLLGNVPLIDKCLHYNLVVAAFQRELGESVM